MKNNVRERFYRELTAEGNLKKYTVRVEETDLLVLSSRNIKREIESEVLEQRSILKNHIAANPDFLIKLSPETCCEETGLISLMCLSSQITKTGPMASVAGAIAETVGRKLLDEAGGELFIENGGDIFACMGKDFKVGIYAGKSPFSLNIGLKCRGSSVPVGIATSSGTVGHSFSSGNADSVTVISGSPAFSDGAATYFCNAVTGKGIDREKIEKEIRLFPFIEGILIIKGKEMFAWGDLELVSC